MTTTSNMPLTAWEAGNANPELLYNELIGLVDVLDPNPVVVDKDLSTPPTTPSPGTLYIVGASPTGVWTGHAGHLAAYTYAGVWRYVVPKNGWLVYVLDESSGYRYNGTSWVAESSGGGSGIPDAPSDGAIYGRQDGSWVDVGGAVAGVSDVNGATGSITLAPGTNITVVESPSGTFTINATGGGGGGSVPWKDFVDDYGADPTFTNDCGPAWDSFITDVEANGSMALRMVGHFKFSRALQNTSAENAQMPLPSIHYVSEAPRTIVLFSDAPACPTVSVIGAEPDYAPGLGIVESTLASGSGNLMAAFGPSGSFNSISNIHVVIQNVMFRTVSNPTITAVNLENAACVKLDTLIDTGHISLADVTYPTSASSYGLKLPKNGNGANTMLGTVDVVGFYNGYSFGEHSIGLNVKAWGCINAFNFLPADHASTFVRMMAVHCNYGIVGPATGAHVLNIQQFDVEHTGSGSYAFVKDVSDAADTLYGYVNWRVVLAGVGGNYNFIVDGAHNFDIKPLAGFPKAFTVSGTNYTAGYWDADRIALFTNASPSTWVIPTDASVPFKIGTILTAIQMGAGQITVDGTAVTPRIPDSYTSRKQYAEIQLVKVGTNEWVLAGDYT